MTLALSLLCENPLRKTGLTSLFVELVERSLRLDSEVRWIVYIAPEHDWAVGGERVEVVRRFPGSNRMRQRLLADHLLLPADARRRGADALVTVGFVPLRTAGLPVAMHMLSLQHLNPGNQVGRLRGLYRSWAASSGLRRAELIITNTEFAVSQILAVNPEVRPRLIQSYEGLQHEFYTPQPEPAEAERLRARFGIEPGYLYWCSNFYPYKQAEKFFEAYARLDASQRQRLPIVMVGGGGWGDGLERAMARADELGIRDRITHLGWVDDEDLAALYRQARLFCLASREETFGRCVIEAMACGTPCVVNDIPVMHEVTAGAARIRDFDQPAEVASAFAQLLDDDEARGKLVAAGLRRAGDFNFDQLTRERLAAIRARLLAGGGDS